MVNAGPGVNGAIPHTAPSRLASSALGCQSRGPARPAPRPVPVIASRFLIVLGDELHAIRGRRGEPNGLSQARPQRHHRHQPVPRTMTFGRNRRGHILCHHGRLCRRRRQFLRHRRRLFHRRLRGDHRALAQGPSGHEGQPRHRQQGPLSDGKGPNDIGLSRKHLFRRARQFSASPWHRAARSLPATCLGCADAHRGNAALPRRRGGRRQDRLLRLFQLPRLAAHQAVHVAKAKGFTAPVTLQPQYNLLVRDIEHEIVPACQDAGMGLLPWSPLGGGWLSGKYKRDQMPTGATRLGENPKRGMEAFEKRNAETRTWTSSVPWRTSPRPTMSAWPRWRSPGWWPSRRSLR